MCSFGGEHADGSSRFARSRSDWCVPLRNFQISVIFDDECSPNSEIELFPKLISLSSWRVRVGRNFDTSASRSYALTVMFIICTLQESIRWSSLVRSYRKLSFSFCSTRNVSVPVGRSRTTVQPCDDQHPGTNYVPIAR